VYQARDTVLGRTVAVKLLTARAAMEEDTRARFLLEARVSSGLNGRAVSSFASGRNCGPAPAAWPPCSAASTAADGIDPPIG